MDLDPIREERTDGERTEETDVPPEPEDPSPDVADASAPLTITLPDGSESVSEAILSHRRMLTNPDDYDLASGAEMEAVRERVEALSAEVPDDLDDEMTALESSVEEMADRLDRQRRAIEELRTTVASLAEVLGTSVDFEDADDS